MVNSNSQHRPPPSNLKERAYLLGIAYERAKFLAACSHTQNRFFRKSFQVVLIPYDEEVLINEAKRIGIGAFDAAKMFKRPSKEMLARGFPYRSKFPKPPGNGDYSLFQHEHHQEITRFLSTRKPKTK